MKRQIRRGVFETNSSSTHTVSIYNSENMKFCDIPKNTDIVLDDSYVAATDIFDELGKLNFIVTMLASIVENKFYEDKLEIKSFEQMIQTDWFKWLAEVVKEESNTNVIYKCPVNSSGKERTYVPYYDTTYDEDDSIEYIFEGNEHGLLNNKDKFKARVKDIIYNKSIIIENKENEY